MMEPPCSCRQADLTPGRRIVARPGFRRSTARLTFPPRSSLMTEVPVGMQTEAGIMNLVPRSALYSFEEFCSVVPDGQKADLIDGVIYMASPDNTDAADLFGWLFWLTNG